MTHVLLPCNVIMYEDGESQSVVSAVDLISMVDVTENPELRPIAEQLTRALARLDNAR